MGGQAFLDHPLVPLGDWEIFGMGRDAVPQRLHVVQLLLDGKFIEAGGRKWQGPSHDRSPVDR
jgi:hypothetical protein